METRKRSLLKTLTYRIGASLLTGLIVYAFTKRLIISASVALIELVIKPVLYFTHERIWVKVKWGKSHGR